MSDAITPVLGASGNDLLHGGSGGDVMSGHRGDDTLYGHGGSDLIHGGSNDDTISGGSGDDILYGGGGPALLRMDQLTISEDYMGRVTFLNEGAGFRNTLGMYRIDADGTIRDLDILFQNASKQGSGGTLIPGQSHVEVALQGGEQIGFFILSNGFGQSTGHLLADRSGDFALRNSAGNAGNIGNQGNLTLWHIAGDGTETALRTQYRHDTFHSAASPENDYALNADGFGHTVGRLEARAGAILLGFEDLRNGGDRDFDDVMFRFDVGESNARVLDPNIIYDADGEQVPAFVYDAVGIRRDLAGNVIDQENDVIHGETGNDRISGGVGHDRLYGGDGDDVIHGNSGDDMLGGDRGKDTLYGGKGEDTVHGGSGQDTLYGDSGNDVLYGGDGDDTVEGGSGDDVLHGDAGNDTLSGGAGNDTLHAGTGDNTLNGGSGDDGLYGGAGNDVMQGGSGHDTLFGADSRDELYGGSGDDALHGEDGNDILDGGSGNDHLDGGNGNDKLSAGTGDDTLEGGDGNDWMHGGHGNDVLDGGWGDDRLFGGSGDDTLSGSAGDNILTGSDGSDCFVFDMEQLSTNLITDFECGLDRIELAGLRGADFLPETFLANLLVTDAKGSVIIAHADTLIKIDNRFGLDDFATSVINDIHFI